MRREGDYKMAGRNAIAITPSQPAENANSMADRPKTALRRQNRNSRLTVLIPRRFNGNIGLSTSPTSATPSAARRGTCQASGPHSATRW